MNEPFIPTPPTDALPSDASPTPATDLVGPGDPPDDPGHPVAAAMDAAEMVAAERPRAEPIPDVPDTADPARADPGRPSVPGRGRRTDVGMLLAASVLSAVLASGATAALWARPAAVAVTASTTAAASPAAKATVTGVTAAASTSSSIAAIAAADSPAVVTIQTTVTAQGRGFRTASATGVGSGFIYGSNGYILTAAHVVEGASTITVTLADGRTFPGAVVASDSTLDVAVVKIADTGLPTIKLAATGAVEVGQTVLAIGDPLGQYPGSVTVGVVSGLDRSITVQDDLTGAPRDLSGLIQTDASINPGNSGGPLIDASGAAIGLISAGSASGAGINFAVPITTAASVVAAAKTA
jgi:serine protease Do